MDESEDAQLHVDGEVFTIKNPSPGTYHFSWETGPHEGYGFTVASSDRSALDGAQLEWMARNFLAQVDPVTGYIEDS